jgi:hypothetical protein
VGAGGCNPLRLPDTILRATTTTSDVKPFVVGHWGTTPGQNFIYVHLNRVITRYDLNMLYVAGPGHGVSARAVAHPVEVIEYPVRGRSIVCRPNRSQQLCWRESTVAATVHHGAVALGDVRQRRI